MNDRINALDDLRSQFAAAAEREIRVAPKRRRRRRFALAFAGVLSVAAVAEGVNLISTGDPVKPVPKEGLKSGVPAFGGSVAVTAEVPGSPLPYAVVIYRRQGEPCAIAGQLRGNEIGEVTNGTFRSFEGRQGGTCGDFKELPQFNGYQVVGGRTLLFGRVGPSLSGVEVTADGEKARPRIGRGGAYLAVFDGEVPVQKLRVKLLPKP